MTSVPSLASQLANVRNLTAAPVDGRAPAIQTPTSNAPPATVPPPSDRIERSIDTQVDAQVNGGALTPDQATSLKDFFGESTGSGSTGSLMRTASEQLDQFDRVLDKLRASLSAGSGYGAARAGMGTGTGTGSGLVVDRLA